MQNASAGSAKKKRSNVTQGNFIVSKDPNHELSTVLGSCVCACLFDLEANIGGMNHFLLPEPSATSSKSIIHGAQAMELLLNSLLKSGARKDRIKGKLFGGSNVLKTELNIGSANAAFAKEFLVTEGIPCVSKCLGGREALQVRFYPVSGKALVRSVRTALVQAIPSKASAPNPNVTLF
ncbi:MAG: chemotaxis protein CheD [Pseudomonadota bacterium]